MAEREPLVGVKARCKSCGHMKYEHHGGGPSIGGAGDCVRAACPCPGFIYPDAPKRPRKATPKVAPFGEGSIWPA